MNAIRPVIFGCLGTELTQDEFAFFKECNPFGFILFKRNCEDPLQLACLIEHLKETVLRDDLPILIDQEGGRVARLKGAEWPDFPPQYQFGQKWAETPIIAYEQAFENAYKIGVMLKELGINVNCSPLLDVLTEYTHKAIGDRAFSTDPEIVFELGKAYIEGYLKAGIKPVIKHLPGHGRATFDSHEDLPVVSASLNDLRSTDFLPFQKISKLYPDIWGMSAHIVYETIDADNPATQSIDVIQKIIREEIGFKGLLLTDDLSMKALKGNFKTRTQKALEAGCDVVLHCNGDMNEMKEIESFFEN
ncbi:MAG: beta-N-acetylhexosaminidase [Alphaproteobacteria bacterium]|nr:beta-N-acetylhexosaminidase [Alphaproteobacteria bacterium]